MEDFKGTKGPWILVKPETDYDYGVVKIGDAEISGQVFFIPSGEGEDTQEVNANLHLIAAAPELLSSLHGLMKRYKELIDSGDCGFWKVEDEDEFKSAQAAINKALGH